MNLDELGREWRDANKSAASSQQRDQLIAATCRHVERFWGQIFRRDIVETIAAVLVIVFFGFVLISPDFSTLERLGAAVIVEGAVYIVYRLQMTRLESATTSAGVPLRDYCQIELIRIEQQITLLRTVHVWYLAPILMGLLLMNLGRNPLNEHFFIVLSIFAAFTWGIYFLNQWAVRTQLIPLRDELLSLRNQFQIDENPTSDQAMAISKGCVQKPTQFWRPYIVTTFSGLAVVMLALAGGFFDYSYAGPPKSNGPSGDSLAKLITDLRKEKKLVGLAAMIMVDGQVMASAADGERKKGSGVAIELTDQWHLGGVTNSITATMIARLIESGQMQWTDTIGHYFPDSPIHEDWKQVSLSHLLTHTSGAPASFSIQVKKKLLAIGQECTIERREAVIDLMSEKPTHPPGENFAYSNVSYTIAGAMAEAATGCSWEVLVKREVFDPLKLADAGFGPPKSPDKTLDQPRGHFVVRGRKISASDQIDNTPIMGPSGAVHMTLISLCKYATEHLRGELGGGTLLTDETSKHLHQPELENYACGWVRKMPTYEIPHLMYWHNGSNTMWYALVVFVPGKNLVVAVTSNDGDMAQAESAAWKVVEASANQINTDEDAALRKLLPTQAFPKKSPFAAVRWQDSIPEVRIGDDWYQLVSLDGMTAGDIVSFSQHSYGEKWRKRFEEDLVELLVRMGHAPSDTARLVVRPVGTSETKTFEQVAMTEANRRAIRASASNR